MPKRPSKRERDAAKLQHFVKQYGRKAQKGAEPNDRQYDRALQNLARQMNPQELDALLRDGEDENSN